MGNADMTLPMNAFKEIPQAKPDAKQIVALVKENGRVVGYKLSDERVVNKADGIQLARSGDIKGVGVSVRKGNEYLKSLPDGQGSNNLSSLPSVTQ
jgi:hypothetical protein